MNVLQSVTPDQGIVQCLPFGKVWLWTQSHFLCVPQVDGLIYFVQALIYKQTQRGPKRLGPYDFPTSCHGHHVFPCLGIYKDVSNSNFP